MNDDVLRLLEEAGERPVAAPDPSFADALEARLLAVAASAPAPEAASGARPVTASGPVPARRTRPARLRLALAGGLLAGTAAIAVLVGIAWSGRPVAPPELSAPVNVQVALADGTILEDPDGLRLPDGAVIRVGSGGSARIGDTVLAPGDVATVEQGRLSVEHAQPVGAVPSATPSPDEPAGATSTPRPTPAPTRTLSPAATPTAVPTGPRPTPSPSPARTPAPTGQPGTPVPAATNPPPTPTPSPTIVRPRLRARVLFEPTRVRVTWTATPGAASYVLVTSRSRLGPAPRPRYPDGRILGEFSRPPETPLRYQVPDGVIEVRLLVVALAPDGTVLARSRVLTLSTVPPVTIVIPDATATPAATSLPTATAAPIGD